MNSAINLEAILVADGLGATLIMALIIGTFRRLRENSPETRLLRHLLAIVMVTCVADGAAFILDGRPGMVIHILLIVLNTWVFSSNMFCGHLWVAFLCNYLNGYLPKRRQIMLSIVSFAGLFLLVVNLIHPIVFYVSDENIYTRLSLFWVYVVMMLLYMLYSLLLYMLTRRSGGELKFFPIWAFILPLFVGTLIQAFDYGIATIWPCIAIAGTCVVNSLQNESIFKDRLTGLYNRFYLDDMKERLKRSNSTSTITAMMLDLNRFKTINDRFGHLTGDEALKDTADILLKSIGSIGSVIRYAGDEFIILLNTQEAEIVNGCIAAIERSFHEFNASSGKPYTLSAAIGTCPLNLSDFSIDETMNEMDRRMYANKRAYYEAHPLDSDQ